jgi:uncharacterized protein DUF1707
MAGPGDEIAAGTDGRGRLRASHGDREQVIEVLKAAFAQGRLDREQFDMRVDRALASRSYADLAALTADIPTQLTRARPAEPARESANKKKKAVTALSCATLAYPGLLAALAPIPDGSPFAVPVMVVMFVLFGAVASGWLLLLHVWLEERAGRQSARGLPPGAGREASRSLPSADPAGQLPQVDHGPRQVAEATPVRHPARHCPAGGRRSESTPSGAGMRSATPATDTACVTRPAGFRRRSGVTRA